MLMADVQVALNDVVIQCRDAVERYEFAAQIVQDRALRAILRDLGAERQANLEAVEGYVREMGGLPRDADGDRETVEHVLTRLRAAFAHDGRAAVLDEQAQAETQLLQALDAALGEATLPERAKTELRGLREQVEAGRDRLSAAHAAL